jgi:hypothetical protein
MEGSRIVEVDEAQEAIAAQETGEAADVAPPHKEKGERRPRRRTGRQAPPRPTATRGSKGEEIFGRVNALTANEGINRSQAFERIAESSGSRPGTVAANYYRVARKRGGEGIQSRSRGGRSVTSASARGQGGRRSSSGHASQLIRDAERALSALVELARSNDQRIAELERENRRYEEVRKILR